MSDTDLNNGNKLVIAWDVDDTLIIPARVTGLPTDTPHYENIAVLKWFQRNGHEVVVWSGGGVDYAKMWAEKLGLQGVEIRPKTVTFGIAIAFDDCDVELAKVNVKVKRINNSIQRQKPEDRLQGQEWQKQSLKEDLNSNPIAGTAKK